MSITIERKDFTPKDINGYNLKIGDLVWLSDSDDWDTFGIIFELYPVSTIKSDDVITVEWACKVLIRNGVNNYGDYNWNLYGCYDNSTLCTHVKKELDAIANHNQYFFEVKHEPPIA